MSLLCIPQVGAGSPSQSLDREQMPEGIVTLAQPDEMGLDPCDVQAGGVTRRDDRLSAAHRLPLPSRPGALASAHSWATVWTSSASGSQTALGY